MSPIAPEIRAEVRHARLKQGLRVKDIALQFRISPDSVRTIVNGNPPPRGTAKATSDAQRAELIAAATAAYPDASPDTISGLVGCGAQFVRDWRQANGLPVRSRRRKATAASSASSPPQPAAARSS